MSECYLIVGTGTGVGKTLITTALAYYYTQGGYKTSALKPVISGFKPNDPLSDSALILKSIGKSLTPENLEAISPWRFSAPVSPHLAGRMEGGCPSLDEVVGFCSTTMQAQEITLIEAAGGVMSPLNESAIMLDWINALNARVILVTGSYLGSISHTLTALSVLPVERLHAVIVSQSAENCAGLRPTEESIRQFASLPLPVYSVPRVNDREEPWKSSTALRDLCQILVKI